MSFPPSNELNWLTSKTLNKINWLTEAGTYCLPTETFILHQNFPPYVTSVLHLVPIWDCPFGIGWRKLSVCVSRRWLPSHAPGGLANPPDMAVPHALLSSHSRGLPIPGGFWGRTRLSCCYFRTNTL